MAQETSKNVPNDEIEKEYENWVTAVYGESCTEIQKTEMRKAFFCGAFSVIGKICEFDQFEAEVAAKKFDDILGELEERVKGWAQDGET